MGTGSAPFRAPTILGLYDAIRSAPLHFPEAPAISPEMKDLLRGLLTKDPVRRLTMPAIMAHPWLATQDAPKLRCQQVRLPALPAWSSRSVMTRAWQASVRTSVAALGRL